MYVIKEAELFSVMQMWIEIRLQACWCWSVLTLWPGRGSRLVWGCTLAAGLWEWHS